MAIKAVIFDVGGVIVRTEDLGPRGKWEARFGLKPWGLAKLVFESEASFQASIGKMTIPDIWKSVGERLSLSEAEIMELQRDFWAGDRADPELIAFIQSLRPRYKTALLTNAWPDARLTLGQRYHLDIVDEIIVSAEEGVAKPDPRIYRIAAERLGVLPEQAIFVDDVEENIAAARAMGMHAIRFKLSQFGSTAAFIRHLQEYIQAQNR